MTFLSIPHFFLIKRKAITHTITESREPHAVAIPIGKRFSGKSFDIKYAPGTRTSTIESKL